MVRKLKEEAVRSIFNVQTKLQRCICFCVISLGMVVSIAPIGLGQGQTAAKTEPEARTEMAAYVIGFLRRGPNWTAEQTEDVKRIGAGWAFCDGISFMVRSGKIRILEYDN